VGSHPLCRLQKGCTRLTAASDKVYQLLIHGRWFSPGTPASSTIKTGSHDIAEIWLKVALNTINQSIKTKYFTNEMLNKNAAHKLFHCLISLTEVQNNGK
jgi:hypothetical protein